MTNFYRTQVYLGSDLRVPSLVDLTDMTLADEDTNSILADNDNREIQGNVVMQVAPPGDQIWIKCKWRHLVAKSLTSASGSFWWPSLEQCK